MLRKLLIVGGIALITLVFVEFQCGYFLYHKEHRRLAIPHAVEASIRTVFKKAAVALPWRVTDARVLWEPRDKNPFIQAEGKIQTYQFHPLIDYTGAFSWDVINGRLDYFGFRNERDYYFESSEDPLIVMTGGSEMAGGHHPFTIAQSLEHQLLGRTGRKWRVLNLGMHSYTVPNEINTFVQLGYKLKAKYVISHSGWNDLLYSLLVPHNFQKMGLSYYKYMESWFQRLYYMSLDPIETTWIVDRRNEPLAEQNYLTNLEKYQKIAETSGAKFIVGIQPYNRAHREGNALDEVYKIVHRLHDGVIATASSKNYLTFPDSLGIHFIDSIHSDPPGATLVAKVYADEILKREQVLAVR